MNRGRSHCVRRTHLEAREGSAFGGLRQSTGQVDPGSDVVFATSHQHPAVFEDGVSVVKRKSAGSAVKVSVKYRLHRCRHCIDTKGRGVSKVFPRGFHEVPMCNFQRNRKGSRKCGRRAAGGEDLGYGSLPPIDRLGAASGNSRTVE